MLCVKNQPPTLKNISTKTFFSVISGFILLLNQSSCEIVFLKIGFEGGNDVGGADFVTVF